MEAIELKPDYHAMFQRFEREVGPYVTTVVRDAKHTIQCSRFDSPDFKMAERQRVSDNLKNLNGLLFALNMMAQCMQTEAEVKTFRDVLSGVVAKFNEEFNQTWG